MNDRKNEIFTQQKQQRADSIFDAVTVEVPLPSKGVVYPPDNSLHNVESVVITAMTAEQENILTNKSYAKKGTLLTELIKSCMQDKTIDVRNMLIGDRTTIMVAMRISGYLSEYKINVKCPTCDETSTQTFNLEKLPIRKLELTPIEPGANKFKFTLPQSKAEVIFKFLTGADEEEISVMSANKKRVIGNDKEEIVTNGLLHSIISIKGITERNKIANSLPHMPAYDSQALRNYIQDNEPGIQMKGEMVCPSCEFVGEVGMPLGASFFWPRAQ